MLSKNLSKTKTYLKQLKKWGIYNLKQFCSLAAGKGIFALPVDRPVDRPTVIFMTVVPPVDWAWKQRVTALCPVDHPIDRNWLQRAELSAGRPGPFPESITLWMVDRLVDRPTNPWLRARLCTSVDWQTAWSNILGIKNLSFYL